MGRTSGEGRFRFSQISMEPIITMTIWMRATETVRWFTALDGAKIQMSNRVYQFSPAAIPSGPISGRPCKFQRLKKTSPTLKDRGRQKERKLDWRNSRSEWNLRRSQLLIQKLNGRTQMEYNSLPLRLCGRIRKSKLIIGRITKEAQCWYEIQQNRIEDNGIIGTEIGSSVVSKPTEPAYNQELREIQEAVNYLRVRPRVFHDCRFQSWSLRRLSIAFVTKG
jgi:hypothetical protein